MKRTEPVSYSAGYLSTRASSDMIAAVHAIAKQRGVKPSEWLRSAISLALQIERGELAATPERE
jgi:hypothetical protein